MIECVVGNGDSDGIVKFVCGSGPGGSLMTRGWGIAARHSGISGLSPFTDLVQ